MFFFSGKCTVLSVGGLAIGTEHLRPEMLPKTLTSMSINTDCPQKRSGADRSTFYDPYGLLSIR